MLRGSTLCSPFTLDRHEPQYPLEAEAEILAIHDCMDAGIRATRDTKVEDAYMYIGG